MKQQNTIHWIILTLLYGGAAFLTWNASRLTSRADTLADTAGALTANAGVFTSEVARKLGQRLSMGEAYGYCLMQLMDRAGKTDEVFEMPPWDAQYTFILRDPDTGEYPDFEKPLKRMRVVSMRRSAD